MEEQENCETKMRGCLNMTEEQAIEKMGEDIRFRNLSESTYRNYTRNEKALRVLPKALGGIG